MLNADIIRKDDDRDQIMRLADEYQNVQPTPLCTPSERRCNQTREESLMRNDDINAPETEDDAREVGHLRMARWRHQNAQLLERKPRRSE